MLSYRHCSSQVFQVKKVAGSHQGQIFAMKVLRKATYVLHAWCRPSLFAFSFVEKDRTQCERHGSHQGWEKHPWMRQSKISLLKSWTNDWLLSSVSIYCRSYLRISNRWKTVPHLRISLRRRTVHAIGERRYIHGRYGLVSGRLQRMSMWRTFGCFLFSFYLSEILLGLEHLHKEGIIYRFVQLKGDEHVPFMLLSLFRGECCCEGRQTVV